MNLRAEKLPPVSVEPMQVLAGLYRSTFVDKMRERFRLMLAGAYAVYIAVLGEESDPDVRVHLADVLHDIAAHTGELVDVFEEELMRSFRAEMDSGSPDDSAAMDVGAKTSRPAALSIELGAGSGVQEFIARSIKGYDTRYGSIILALTRTFVKLTDQPVESFRPPWTPARLFAAFAVVLDQVGMPMHGAVKLALYKMFSQEVLRYLGDGCMDFRYALPHSLAELTHPAHERAVFPALTGLHPVSPASGLKPDTAADSDSRRTSAVADAAEREGSRIENSTATAKPPKFAHVGLALFGCAALMAAGWWIGVYIARTRPLTSLSHEQPVPGNLSQSEAESTVHHPSAQARALVTNPSTTTEAPLLSTAGVPVKGGEVLSRKAGPISAADSYERREMLRGLKLKNFAWKIDAGTNEMLFTLTLMNANLVNVGGVEVVCSQYSGSLDFLEAAKAVLAEPVEAGQTKIFKAVPIGSASEQVDRVNCVIADLQVMASP
ncbi:hypothetical protein [Methylomagnum sp.]